MLLELFPISVGQHVSRSRSEIWHRGRLFEERHWMMQTAL